MYHSTATSAESIVLADEIIGMVKVMMGGMEINSETLPLELIEQLGPKSSYISEDHTYQHFHKFWVPTIFDRSFTRNEDTKGCKELLDQKTRKILETYQPKPLQEDLVKVLKKMEKSWFEQAGLSYAYPKRKDI